MLSIVVMVYWDWVLASPSPEFDFISLEVGLALHHLDETLTRNEESRCCNAKKQHFLINNTENLTRLSFTVSTVTRK